MHKLRGALVLFFILISISSCVNDLDFTQADAVDLNTPITLSFINFQLNQDDFYDEDDNIISDVQDETIIHLDDLLSEASGGRVVLENYLSNSFDTDIIVTIDFFNNADEIILSLPEFIVPMNNESFQHSIVINEDDFYNFKAASKVRYTIHLDDSSVIYPLAVFDLVMQSTLNFSLY